MSYSAPLAYAPPCLWFRCFILYSGCLSVSLCLVNVWRATECRATVTVRKFFLSVRTVFFQLTVWYRLFGLGFIKCVFSFLFDLGAVMGCERVARLYNVRVMCDGSVFEHIMSGVSTIVREQTAIIRIIIRITKCSFGIYGNIINIIWWIYLNNKEL